MSLYTRLLGTTDPKIAVHQFMAALAELERAQVTRQAVVDAFGLDTAEGTELDTLTAKFFALPEVYPFSGDITLTNLGTAYDTLAQSRALGFVRLQCQGVTGAELTVRYNQQTAGQLDWQLWNETDAAQVGVISTTGTGDNKSQTSTFTPSVSPMPAGLKVLRLRVKSAVSTDDAYLYAWCLRVTRAGAVREDVLHDVLLLAESGLAYTTEAALKSRLGV